MAPSSPRARTRTRRSPFSRWRCALPSGLPPGSGQEPSHDAVAPRNAAMGDGRGGAAARPLDARDASINLIYEGTHGIQALDLLGRTVLDRQTFGQGKGVSVRCDIGGRRVNKK